MRLLLDSNIVVPIVCDEREKLSAQIRLLLSAFNEIHVSVASLWEIAIKARLGKLPLGIPVQQLPIAISAFGYVILPVEHHHAVEDLLDEPNTRDRFDRMLLAQCQVEQMRLVTTDRTLTSHTLSWQPA